MPFAVEEIPFNMHGGPCFIRDFLACLIPVRIECGTDVEARLRRRIADQVDNDFMTHERTPPPVLGNIGAHPMFNLIPFTGAWRQMTHRNAQPDLVGQPLQCCFPQPYPHPMAAAPIGGR